VVSLIVFRAVIGMFLASPGMVALWPLAFGATGIPLVAGAAAAANCLLEQKIDALMARRRVRRISLVHVMTVSLRKGLADDH
jgi:protoheme IX farnesyltransferase